MDGLELSHLLMQDVKNKLTEKYHTNFNDNNSLYYLRSTGQPSTISFSCFTASVNDFENQTVLHYEFWKKLGEICTYLQFHKCSDDSLNIIHARCIRDNNARFALMVSGCNISSFAGELTADAILKWPYPFFGITLGETIQLMNNRGKFTFKMIDPEFAIGLEPEQIISSIDNLVEICEQKLQNEFSR